MSDDGLAGEAGVDPLLRSIAESSPVTMMLLDLEHRIQFINRVVAGLDAAEVIGNTVYHYVAEDQHAAMRASFERVFTTREQDTYQNVYRSREGVESMWEARVSAVVRNDEVTGFVVFASDVTKQRALEAQLLQAQKMDAIGQLAGGIAHDFNNLMLAVGANAVFARRAIGDNEEAQHHIAQVEKAAQRATMLTKQLLAMSRRGRLRTTTFDLDDLVAEMVTLLRRLIPASVEIHCSRGDRPRLIEADAAKIEQIVLNLALNARDAMPDGGRLTLSTRRVDLDHRLVRRVPSCSPGPYVVLSVRDEGVGMTPDVRARAFEPFFTTKAVGNGTGLGLATVYGVVEQHRGGIRVETAPDAGTTFEVYLPAAQHELPVRHRGKTPEMLGGRETILIAEDELLVRSAVRKQLTSAGYDVIVASDGEEAVALFAANAARIALVFLDIDMPGINGPDAYRHMKELREDLPVVFTTGYSSRDGLDSRLPANARLLDKPYEMNELLEQIRRAIHGAIEV